MSFLSVDLHSKSYPNGVCAAQDLRFAAKQGEFIAIVGPSGTGKSTLLNLIAGLDKDFTGKISYPPQTTLSFMFQEPRLLPWLSVADNIRLVLDAPQHRHDSTRLARMDALLQQLGLQDFRDSFPNQLSGGMKRRAALVRAFVTQPQLLLMDEPFQFAGRTHRARLTPSATEVVGRKPAYGAIRYPQFERSVVAGGSGAVFVAASCQGDFGLPRAVAAPAPASHQRIAILAGGTTARIPRVALRSAHSANLFPTHTLLNCKALDFRLLAREP